MCLEFLCSWSNRDEDGPMHHRPRTPRTGWSAGSEQNYPTEPKNHNNYPSKNGPPSKPPFESSINGSETRKDEYSHVYPVRDEPLLKPRSTPYTGHENQVISGVAVNGDMMSKAIYPGPSVSVPHVRNNTVLAAPVLQPIPRRGAESNVLHTSPNI